MTNQPLDPNQTTLSETFSAPVPADITETEHKSPAYHATLADMVFAFLYYGIGYFFLDAFLGNSWNNFKFFFFVLTYCVCVLTYTFLKQKRPAKESWFWLVIVLALGLPLEHWATLGLAQLLLLPLTAAYWTLSVSGCLLDDGKTSSLCLADAANACFVVPFCNFKLPFSAMLQACKNTRSGKQLLSVLLGLLISIPVLGLILPQLGAADPRFADSLSRFFAHFSGNLSEYVLKFLFSIPISMYLFGLISGSLHKRCTNVLRVERLHQTAANMRVFPSVVALTPLFLLSLLYILFMILQSSYLFQAFVGKLPVSMTYAEYARQGFFELCRISAWNLFFLLLANIGCKKNRLENPALRFANFLLAVLTLLLLATALSKMVLYIRVYGFTQLRVITSTFLLWLAGVFILFLIWQKKQLPIVRYSLLAGAAICAFLCALPLPLWLP